MFELLKPCPNPNCNISFRLKMKFWHLFPFGQVTVSDGQAKYVNATAGFQQHSMELSETGVTWCFVQIYIFIFLKRLNS